jgi:succinate dehydrogenase flavin-adding protein (antitoxin of CptAB toxin-antitoxin module)
MMGWLSFQIAAEEIERRLGLSWGAAQKGLLEACEKGEMRTQKVERFERFPDVLDADFFAWLEAKLKRDRGGKQPRIRKLLAEMFQGRRVPNPKLCPRDRLRADIVKADRSLHPLDFKTLSTAIKAHNSEVGNVGNTNVSD